MLSPSRRRNLFDRGASFLTKAFSIMFSVVAPRHMLLCLGRHVTLRRRTLRLRLISRLWLCVRDQFLITLRARWPSLMQVVELLRFQRTTRVLVHGRLLLLECGAWRGRLVAIDERPLVLLHLPLNRGNLHRNMLRS